MSPLAWQDRGQPLVSWFSPPQSRSSRSSPAPRAGRTSRCVWGAASPPQSPRAAWHRSLETARRDDFWQAGPPVRVEGRWEAGGVLRPSSPLRGWGLAPDGQGGCVQEGAGPRSFVGTKLHRLLHAQRDHGLWLHFSPSVLSLNSVLPVRHLRAKARGPQERKGDREAPWGPSFPREI